MWVCMVLFSFRFLLLPFRSPPHLHGVSFFSHWLLLKMKWTEKMGTSVALTAKRKNTPPKVAFSAPIFRYLGFQLRRVSIGFLYEYFTVSVFFPLKKHLKIENMTESEGMREWEMTIINKMIVVCVTLECVSTGRERKYTSAQMRRHAKYLYLHPNSLRLLYHPKMAA